MPLGTAYPIRNSVPNTSIVMGKWTGGGAAANMSVATGDWNSGIASVAYNAATGKYLLTFVDVGQQIVHCDAKVHRHTTGDDPYVANIMLTSFSSTAKTVPVEFTAADGVSLVDIATTDKVTFFFVFSKNPTNA